MATQLNLTDNLSTLRTNFNGLVVEFNNVASISSVTTDAGIISVGSGQTNRNININGGSNIQTNVNGASIEVNIVTNPVFTGLSATGTVSFTGTFSTSNATIGTLTVGTSAPTQYTFPTAVGAEGQALVVNSSGNLEFGLGGVGVTNFKGLTDTPSDYSTLGGRVLVLDGTAGGVANNVITDSELTFDPTNNILSTKDLHATSSTGQVQIRTYDEPFASFTDYSYNPLNVFYDEGVDTNFAPRSIATFIGQVDAQGSISSFNGIDITMISPSVSQRSITIINEPQNSTSSTGYDLYNVEVLGNITHRLSLMRDFYASHTLIDDGSIDADPQVYTEYSYAWGRFALSEVRDGCIVGDAYALKFAYDPGTGNAANVFNSMNGVDVEFGDVNLDGTQVGTMSGITMRASSGTFTDNAALASSYAINSQLPLQSSFSGPVRINLTSYPGDKAQPITVSGVTARNPVSGANTESLEIVVNGSIRYIPLYSAVT